MLLLDSLSVPLGLPETMTGSTWWPNFLLLYKTHTHKITVGTHIEMQQEFPLPFWLSIYIPYDQLLFSSHQYHTVACKLGLISGFNAINSIYS